MKVHLIFLPKATDKDKSEIKPREVIELESLPPLYYASYWKVDGDFWKVKDFTMVTQRGPENALEVTYAVITLQLSITIARPPTSRNLKLVE